MQGKLYIIATPIGNLSDITLRAIEILKSVDMVLSEDTRETDKVLRKYGISAHQISYRDQNHSLIYTRIKESLSSGQSLALVSDSGTPLISDPGFKLVRDLIRDGFEVLSIPGPSALISSLVVSGLPTDKFSFLGFLPKSSGERKKLLTEYGSLDGSIIIYESPFRIIKLLEEVLDMLGNRSICIVNDQTKVFEKIYRGYTTDIINQISKSKIKGEFVVIIAKEGI